MSRVVFWTGPVNIQQVEGAVVPDAKILNVTCKGNGSPSCGQFADGWGTNIPGIKPTDEIFFGAFSAGGSAVKRLLIHPEVRAQTTAVMLADAMYTDWASVGNPTPIEGFVLYALDAIDGPKLFVATVSGTPNIATAAANKGQVLPSGSQSMAATKAEIEKRSGQTFTAVDPTTLGITPAPVLAWRLGNVLFVDYQMTLSHGGQATVAPQYWQNILQPWLSGTTPETNPLLAPPVETQASPNNDLLDTLVFAAGAAAGFAVTRWAAKRFK